tara:strand:+ start:339 stop:899 length:561 start_codon:yes stop_codon:yes gene_type:complete
MNQKIFVIDDLADSSLGYYDKIIPRSDDLTENDFEERYPDGLICRKIASILQYDTNKIKLIECSDNVQKDGEKSPICCHLESDYIGIWYITLPLIAWGEVGIKFYSNKETGLDSFPTQEEVRKYNITDINKTFSQDLGNWNEYGSIPIKHNRLILFRSNLWHSYGNGFGLDLNTSMLYKKIIIKNG